MKQLFLCLTILFTVNEAIAQEFKFSVIVNRDTVKMGQIIELTFTFENSTGKFQAPPLEDFEVLGSPSHSTMMSMSFGGISRSSSYTYRLKPRRTGLLTIEKASLIDDKKTFYTDEVKIFVMDNPDFFENNPKPLPKQEGSRKSDEAKNRPTFKI